MKEVINLQEKILVVDDEKNIADTIIYALKRDGYTVEAAYDGKEALAKVQIFKPQIIILDIMLPEMDGYEVCRRLDKEKAGIIMLTAKNDIVDKILGLEFGADDYLTKPFDIREVIARVKSLLRRLNKSSADNVMDNIIEVKDFILNKNERTAFIDGKEIELTAMEFDLIFLLLSNKNRAYTREQLLNIVWGIDYMGTTRTVDTHVQRIRKKLGAEYQSIIQTVHGVGYKGADIIENRNQV